MTKEYEGSFHQSNEYELKCHLLLIYVQDTKRSVAFFARLRAPALLKIKMLLQRENINPKELICVLSKIVT